MKKNDNKQCFVITPIGNDGSEVRTKADGVFEAVVKPVLESLGYVPMHPGKMTDLGSITNQIINELFECDLVIANLTGLNPNVMYELAICHAMRKSVVCIIERGTDLPFDISGDRVIFYRDNMFNVNLMKKNLESAIISATSSSDVEVDNPIVRAIKDKNLINDIISDSSNPNRDVLRVIFDRLSIIEKNTNRGSIFKKGDFVEFNDDFGTDILFGDIKLSDEQISDAIKTTILHYVGLGIFVALVFDKEKNVLTVQNGNHSNEDMGRLINDLKYKLKINSNIEYKDYPF